MLHDPDLAEVILDSILERGTHISLDGASGRRKHLPEIDDIEPTKQPAGVP